jgi:hypothetical protein
MRIRLFLTSFINLSLHSPVWSIIVVLLGVMVTGLATNSIYEILGFSGQIGVWIIILTLSLTAYAIFRFNVPTSELIVQLNEKQGVRPKKHLITGLSPLSYRNGTSNLDVVINLIKENNATDVYLVSLLKRDPETDEVYAHTLHNKDNQGVLDAYELLKQTYPTNVEFHIESIHNADSSKSAYDATAKVLDQLKQANKLSDTVVDVTAGRKAMSVGLSAAAIQFGIPMTYLVTPRNKDGEPDTTGLASVITTLYTDELKRAILLSDDIEQSE